MLRERMEWAVRGRGTAILIRGAAGIGKTALIEEATAWASSRDFAVYRGSVTELERDVPFGVVADALSSDGSGSGAFEALTAAVDPSAHGAVGYVVARRIVEQVENTVRTRPVLIVLEDMQWADHASMVVVEHLVRVTRQLPLISIVTHRDTPRSPALDRLEEVRDVETMDLEPLSLPDLEAMAGDILGHPPGPDMVAALRDVEGSPLLAMLVAETATWKPGTSLPAPAAGVIARHLDLVSDATRETLRAASILGSRFRLVDLATITASDTISLLPRLAAAIEAGLVTEHRDQLAFRHDLIWQAVYESIPETVRRALHREFAHRLARHDGAPDQLIAHLTIGAHAGDPGDVDLLRRAAERVAPTDPATAAGLYERALHACDDDDLRAGLMSSLVFALLWSGQLYRARVRAEALLAGPSDPAVKGDLHRALAHVLAHQGRVAESLEETERGLQVERLPDTQRARLLADASLRRLVCRDRAGALQAGTEALELARRCHDPVALTMGHCALSRLSGYDGDGETAVDLAVRARSGADDAPREAIEVLHSRLYEGLALVDAGRYEEARGAFRAGRELAERRGSVWIAPLFHLGSCVESFLIGDWDRAQAEGETGLLAADELNVSVWSPWTHAVLALIDVARGEATALDHLEAVERLVRANGTQQYGDAWLTWSKLRGLEASGQGDAAIDVGLADWASAGPATGGDRRVYGVDLIRLLLAAGQEEDAHRVLRVLHEVAAPPCAPADAAAAVHAEGLVTDDAALVRSAIERFETAGLVPAAARAAEDAARMLRDGGDADAAVGYAERAVTSLERLGAVSDLSRVEALLRSLGINRGVRRSRRRARTGWESVTATETQVLELLAAGLTNRLIGERMFISPRTVETHVSHLFAKLGVSSRSELAARFAEHRASER